MKHNVILFFFLTIVVTDCGNIRNNKVDVFFTNETLQSCFDVFIDSTKKHLESDSTMFLVTLSSNQSDTIVSFIYSTYPLVISIEKSTDIQYAYYYRGHIVSVFSSNLDNFPSSWIVKKPDSLLLHRMVQDASSDKAATCLRASIARYIVRNQKLEVYKSIPHESKAIPLEEEDSTFLDDSFPY